MDKPWHLYVMAVFYILAGINHFRKPDVYYKIIPPFLTNKKFINEISGLLEIMFGIYLCIPIFSNLAAISIIILLLLIFPANIYMLINYQYNFYLYIGLFNMQISQKLYRNE
jgi:uncharacterized membrane protein